MLRRVMRVAAVALPVVMCNCLSASAEDLWTGGYVGAHVGGAWGDLSTHENEKDWCAPGDAACIAKFVGPFDWTASGAFGGGTIGYNFQLSGFVLGVEGDLGYMDLSGAGATASAHANQQQNLTIDAGLYGDITGRIGVLVTPATLLYGKGGFAFYDGAAAQTTTNPGYSSQATDTFTGWTAGGGVEHMIAPNISIKAEYLHFDFGEQDGGQTALVDDFPTPKGYVFKNYTKLSADSVKLGLAYHF